VHIALAYTGSGEGSDHLKGSHVHVAYASFGEGSDHFQSYVQSLFLHFYKSLFLGFEPMTSRSQSNSFTTVPGLPF
jgi:hypothetical protein